MTATTEGRTLSLTLSREEQWVLHHVMLDRMELESRSPEAGAPPVEICRIFDKLESGTYRFTARERRRLRSELDRYAEARDTPDRDRPTARRLLERLQRGSRRSIPRTGP